MSSTTNEDGWELARASHKRSEANTEAKAIQSSNLPRFKIEGFEFFIKEIEGRCFKCFSPNHIARFCRLSHTC